MTEKRPIATIADVARLAGVSTATVSRTLRRPSLVSGPTRARVLSAADALSYSLTKSASSLASGRTEHIALLNGGSLNQWFTSEIINGAYTVIHEHHLDLTVYRARDTSERREFFETLPARRNADAMLVTSFNLSPDEFAILQRLGMPIVLLNMLTPGHTNVSIDDAAAGRDVARLLLELGHDTLAYVGPEPGHRGLSWSSDARWTGFHDEIRTRAPFASVSMVRLPAPLVTDAAQHAVSELLARRPRPTAIFVQLDELAIPIMFRLRQRGIRIPEDISVIGFDDHPLAKDLGLTTVRQPVGDIGARGADLAIRLIADDAGTRHEVLVPTTIIERSTTAGPAL